MPKVIKIRNPEKVIAEATRFFTESETGRFIRRIDIILLVCAGHPISTIAKLFNYNPTTIQRWVNRVNEMGLSGLGEAEGRGRKPTLSDKQRQSLARDLTHPPSHFGYEQSRWDGKILSHYLEKRYGAKLKVRRCQLLFHELGFSLQRPRKMPTGGDTEKQEAFKKNS